MATSAPTREGTKAGCRQGCHANTRPCSFLEHPEKSMHSRMSETPNCMICISRRMDPLMLHPVFFPAAAFSHPFAIKLMQIFLDVSVSGKLLDSVKLENQVIG